MIIREGLICLLAFCSFSLFATTFIQQPIERQLIDSTAVVHGKYLGENSKKLPSGDIVTEVSLKVIESAGVVSRYLNHSAEFKVLYPGGQWLDVVHYVSGTPTFKEGEDVVLLLKQNSDGFWINNLSLGKYNITDNNNKKYIISSVFPNNPQISNIEYKDFRRMVVERFGYPLVKFRANDLVVKRDPSEDKENIFQSDSTLVDDSRAPASDDNKRDSAKDSVWFLILIGLLTLAAFFWLKKKS